jgi:hypothetical protein
MIVGLVIYAAAAASAEADAANLAYVQCLFAQSRSAHQAGMSPSQFETMLAGRCRAEERALQQNGGNGGSSGQETRAIIVKDYRRIVELAPELHRLGELCRANPEQCR